MGTVKLLGDNLTKCWEGNCDGGVEILLVASYYRNLRQAPALMSLLARPITTGADFTYKNSNAVDLTFFFSVINK